MIFAFSINYQKMIDMVKLVIVFHCSMFEQQKLLNVTTHHQVSLHITDFDVFLTSSQIYGGRKGMKF